jgi:hypothetical protein
MSTGQVALELWLRTSAATTTGPLVQKVQFIAVGHLAHGKFLSLDWSYPLTFRQYEEPRIRSWFSQDSIVQRRPAHA